MKIVIVFCFVNIFSNIVYSQIVPSQNIFLNNCNFNQKFQKLKKVFQTFQKKIIDYSKLSKLSKTKSWIKNWLNPKSSIYIYTVDTSINKYGKISLMFLRKDSTLTSINYVD